MSSKLDSIVNELVVPFTMIPNDILSDSLLSLKQKGMLCYLISLPKGWTIYKSELESHFTDGRESISNAIEDLVELGFVSKVEKPKEKGKFSGFTYTVLPLRVNRNGLSATDNPQLINTNNSNTYEEIDSKLSNAEFPSETSAVVLPSLTDMDKCRMFIQKFNDTKLIKGKRGQYKDSASICGQLKQRLKKYKSAEIFKALLIAMKDSYHIDTKFKYITPEYILREKILERYLNQETDEIVTTEKRTLVH